MIERRSRMRRTRSGKRLEITDRDIAIFKLLRQYRYLRSTYIHAFVGGASGTRFTERLGDLFHEGYLDRPRQQWEFADARYRPAVHEIGAGALRVLRGLGEPGGETRTFLAGTAHRQFLHSMMICEAFASIQLGVRDNPSLRLIGWQEILGRSPEATRCSAAPFRIPVPSGGFLVPDGLFGIEYQVGESKAYRFFALEADRGTMPISRSDPKQTSCLAKLAAYREIIKGRVHRSHLGIPNLLVLTLTTSRARVTDMIARLEGLAGNSAAFLFKALPEDAHRTPSPQLLSEPWERAGYPPLCIAESD